jgi:hypothetical protein
MKTTKKEVIKMVRDTIIGLSDTDGLIVRITSRGWDVTTTSNCSPTQAMEGEKGLVVFFCHEANPPMSLKEAKEELEEALARRELAEHIKLTETM